MIGSAYSTDAVGVLKDDHREVEDLLERFQQCSEPAERLELAQAICQSLLLHAHLEQALFYPALRAAGLVHELVDQAEVEHQTLCRLIDDLDGARLDAALFDARMRVLRDYLAHHVEEEENEIMPRARSLPLDLDALGEDILARKAQLETRVHQRIDAPQPGGRVELLKVDGDAGRR